MAVVQVIAGAQEYATDVNNALAKRIGSTKTVADSAATSGTTVLGIGTLVVSLTSGMTYALKWTGRVSGSVTGDIALLRIHPTSTATTELSVSPVYIGLGGTTAPASDGYNVDVYCEYTAPSSGSFTFVASLTRTSGTGVLIARAAALAPAFLTCDYIGF